MCTPRLRSFEKPWGLEVLDEATLVGNMHAAQCFLAGLLQVELGLYFALEQPATGIMTALGPWNDSCFTNLQALSCVGRKCCHNRKHARLEGRLTLRAGAYSETFCDRVAFVLGTIGMSFGGDQPLRPIVKGSC